MNRRSFLVGAPLVLAGCGATPHWSTSEFIQQVAYRDPGPAYLTLFTMKNVQSDNGAHTGLMINASQRVIFDAAGTFGHESIPERNDVHYGINDRIAQFYISYHARATYYLLIQKKIVPDAVAERAKQLVEANGAVPKSFCTQHTSRAIAKLPGFESIRPTFFPDRLAKQFGALPGVEVSTYRENDSDDKSLAQAAFDRLVRDGMIQPGQ